MKRKAGTDPLVAFDEAGNSGGNLLDADQPVFVLASVSLSEKEASSLLGPRDREYKFATLRRSRAGQRSIIDLLNSTRLTDEHYLISVFHKPFVAVTKLVDLLVEPLAHHDGVDLYERGANLALSNLFYFCLPTLVGRGTFDRLIALFVAMVRAPDHNTIETFYAHLVAMYERHRKADFAGEIALLLATRVIAEDYVEKWDGSDLDPAMPAFVRHASLWTGRLGRPFKVVHDVSKPIANEQLVLEALMSTTDETQRIGYDRRRMNFPITAQGIDFRDSATYPQIQVADLLASSAAYALKSAVSGVAGSFASEILATRVLSGSVESIWPELKVTPEELGTTEYGGSDVVNYIGEYVSKRLGGIPVKGRRRKT